MLLTQLRDPAPPLASLGLFFFGHLIRDVQVFAEESKVSASFMYVVRATLLHLAGMQYMSICHRFMCVDESCSTSLLCYNSSQFSYYFFYNIYTFFLKKEKRKKDYKFTITICYKIQ